MFDTTIKRCYHINEAFLGEMLIILKPEQKILLKTINVFNMTLYQIELYFEIVIDILDILGFILTLIMCKMLVSAEPLLYFKV